MAGELDAWPLAGGLVTLAHLAAEAVLDLG
jgi:hypothetical protein